MLRAFNAEADNLVRALKPHKLSASIERLKKVSATIEKLGKTMSIRISTPYELLRIRELELTADFLQKQAAEKEAERLERERLKEERRAQQEMERERARLEKERQHYQNALAALVAKGDAAAAERLRAQLDDVDRAIADVDYRAANIRAGYVYVISNIGSFGEQMVKVGMTRRLDPLDRIRELSDASVPFNFDVHALFFSKDAVGIEAAMHERLAASRVNVVNRRREFFSATAIEVKRHLAELTGEMLEFNEIPEALEYRQCLLQRGNSPTGSAQALSIAVL
jgi:multidrug efflux pump subunit AcrA (membrane-fusion protein)